MYRLPNPRHDFAGAQQTGAIPGLPPCPLGQVLVCEKVLPSHNFVTCRCVTPPKTKPSGGWAAGEREPLGLSTDSSGVGALSCPEGYVLKYVKNADGSFTVFCSANGWIKAPTISQPSERGLTANPQRLISKQGQFACPHGYVRWCYTQGGEVKCMCRKCMVTPEGIPDCLYAPPLPSGGTNTRGLTANPHRRRRPRYHRVANFFR